MSLWVNFHLEVSRERALRRLLTSGAAEPGVQGVQLRTLLLAPSSGENHLFHANLDEHY